MPKHLLEVYDGLETLFQRKQKTLQEWGVIIGRLLLLEEEEGNPIRWEDLPPFINSSLKRSLTRRGLRRPHGGAGSLVDVLWRVKIESHSCPVCGRIFQHYGSLTRHELRCGYEPLEWVIPQNHTLVTCEIGGYATCTVPRQRKNMFEHRRDYHPKVVHFRCRFPSCGLTKDTEKDMESHELNCRFMPNELRVPGRRKRSREA